MNLIDDNSKKLDQIQTIQSLNDYDIDKFNSKNESKNNNRDNLHSKLELINEIEKIKVAEKNDKNNKSIKKMRLFRKKSIFENINAINSAYISNNQKFSKKSELNGGIKKSESNSIHNSISKSKESAKYINISSCIDSDLDSKIIKCQDNNHNNHDKNNDKLIKKKSYSSNIKNNQTNEYLDKVKINLKNKIKRVVSESNSLILNKNNDHIKDQESLKIDYECNQNLRKNKIDIDLNIKSINSDILNMKKNETSDKNNVKSCGCCFIF